ncbi:probable mediator of RNA polymerase II transcription subunit 26b [Musa acuminata AAA Group]|uniref:probable mediator of RNA polymerase II transcription subunit 26b n=1 Tax=Musa acuminata AAA Group TaxID=214697 RepID=UPI0031D814FD
MASSSGSIDYWRKFFRSANSDIFGVIEQAVAVAASDYPQEFRSRRDQIVEKFFTALLPRCLGCDRVEPRGAEGDGSGRKDGEKERESKVGSSNDGPEELNRAVSNNSYDEAEALTEEVQEESQTVGEVLRIKEILEHNHDESDSLLYELLRRLQSMQLSVEVLKATEIGKAVNGLRKHNLKQIRHLVRALIDGWKVLVDEWVNATAAIADSSPDSLNPCMVDEEGGIPCPSLDEGVFLAAQTTSIQNSKFFDGMDEDGNYTNNGHEQLRKQQPRLQLAVPEEKGEMRRQELRKPLVLEEKKQMRRQEQQSASQVAKGNLGREEPIMRRTKPQELSVVQEKPQVMINRQNNRVIPDTGPGRSSTLSSEQKNGNEMNHSKQQEVAALQRKPRIILQDKSKYSEEASVQAKLEVSKRKLHEGYQQADNAKRQRTIQVMELQDIPRQAHNSGQSVMKSRNLIRSSANSRHQFS